MVQTSKVTGDIHVPMHARHGHTSGVDHPRAVVHLGGPHNPLTPRTWVVRCRAWQRRPQSNYVDDHSWWELPHSDSIDRVPNESREI